MILVDEEAEADLAAVTEVRAAVIGVAAVDRVVVIGAVAVGSAAELPVVIGAVAAGSAAELPVVIEVVQHAAGSAAELPVVIEVVQHAADSAAELPVAIEVADRRWTATATVASTRTKSARCLTVCGSSCSRVGSPFGPALQWTIFAIKCENSSAVLAKILAKKVADRAAATILGPTILAGLLPSGLVRKNE